MLPRKQRPTTNKIQGFTLIELLVVMAVMSILVGIGVNTFSIAQKKARDAKRKADLRTLKTAYEAYKLTTGNYPRFYRASDNTELYGYACLGDGNHSIESSASQYLPSTQKDLLNGTSCPCYLVAVNATNLVLYAKLEDT